MSWRTARGSVFVLESQQIRRSSPLKFAIRSRQAPPINATAKSNRFDASATLPTARLISAGVARNCGDISSSHLMHNESGDYTPSMPSIRMMRCLTTLILTEWIFRKGHRLNFLSADDKVVALIQRRLFGLENRG